ncbi:MAG: hypothetical protein ACE5KM_04130 [Planctomycetaceae bacterium]
MLGIPPVTSDCNPLDRPIGESDPRLIRWIAAGLLLAIALQERPALAQVETPDFFRQRCFGCHTIGGGRLQGPDLKNVVQSAGARGKDREWLIGFMLDPSGVIDSGDRYANELLREAKGVRMTPIPGLTRDRAEKLLDLIEEESKKEKSQFQGVKLITRPFNDADRARGRELFIGSEKLENGGVACISCHSMHDMPALGGGRLGPDLTRVIDRLKNRKTLGAWLAAPGTPTMAPLFAKDHPLTAEEIHALSAYFVASAKQSESDPSAGRVSFLLLGLLVAAGMVFGLDAIWRRRFHAVRQPLVEAESLRGHS